MSPAPSVPLVMYMLANDELFAGVQRADPDAWAEFVDRFGPLVQALAARSGLDVAEAEDVGQATFAALLRHAPLVREPRSLPAWVLVTARREAWRLRRRRRRSAAVEEEVGRGRAAELEEPLDVDLERLERIQLVRDALARLGGRCAALLCGLFLDDPRPPYETLAARLGIAVGSIGPIRQRCLAKLALDLAERGFEPEDGP